MTDDQEGFEADEPLEDLAGDLPVSDRVVSIKFAHPSERVAAQILDYYQIAWEYEPTTFPLEWDKHGNVLTSFAPDFFLPEFDLYIAYWGLEGNLDYQVGMLEKKTLYQQAGKKRGSLYAHEKPRLREALREKLAMHVRLPSSGERAHGTRQGTT